MKLEQFTLDLMDLKQLSLKATDQYGRYKFTAQVRFMINLYPQEWHSKIIEIFEEVELKCKN